MDPWQPINGISLERYAELSAEVANEKDPDKQAAILGALGVARADWEAAKTGWTARMQDMSLMGQVATRYMPLYNAALAKKTGGAPNVSFEDYVAMSGCVPVMGHAAMLAHYKLTEAQWSQIAMQWNQQIPTNPQYMQFGVLVEQEAARIRNGGQPRPLGAARAVSGNVSTPDAFASTAPAPQPAAAPYPQAPAYPQPGYPQQPGYAPGGYPYPQPGYHQQAQDLGAQVGSAFNAFGNALGSFVDSAIGNYGPGARVMVQWSDGKRYPGTVAQARSGQVEVAFPDGRRVWVPQAYVSVVY